MRYISGCVGNLADTPVLREGEHGPYTFATVMVSDRLRTKGDKWEDGPAIAYNVAVKGDEAKRLVEAAERDGNVRVTFGGRYRVTQWESETGPKDQHEVQADSIGLSFRGQDIGVLSGKKKAAAKDSEDDAAGKAAGEPTDIFEEGGA